MNIQLLLLSIIGINAVFTEARYSIFFPLPLEKKKTINIYLFYFNRVLPLFNYGTGNGDTLLTGDDISAVITTSTNYWISGTYVDILL